jgi:hypothetical protein
MVVLHALLVSAEKPLGIASQALTQALPSFRRFFSMFVDIGVPLFVAVWKAGS